MRHLRQFIIFWIAIPALVTILPNTALGSKDDIADSIKNIEMDIVERGDFHKALKEAESLLKEHPKDHRLYMNIGMAYYGLMQYDRAYNFLNEAVALDRKNDLKKFLKYAISKIEANRDSLNYISEKNALLEEDGGRKVIIDMLKLRHIDILHDILSDKYYYAALANAHVTWLKKNAPETPGLRSFSGDVNYSAMLYSAAEDDYREAIDANPGDAELHKKLADCLVAVGDFDNASEYYDKAINLYKKKGISEDDRRISELKKISQALPKKYSDIAAFLKKKRYRDAETICKKRISLNPGDYVAITQLGEIYWERDKRREASKLFQRATKIAPDYPTAHLFLGKSLFFSQKYKRALKEFSLFRKKMKMLPEMDDDTLDFYISALHSISYFYSSLKRYDKMARMCKEIIALRPDDQSAHYNLAICHYKHYRNRSRAYNELKKVIEIDYATVIADKAEYFIAYIRRNPDPRFTADFTFIFDD